MFTCEIEELKFKIEMIDIVYFLKEKMNENETCESQINEWELDSHYG